MSTSFDGLRKRVDRVKEQVDSTNSAVKVFIATMCLTAMLWLGVALFIGQTNDGAMSLSDLEEYNARDRQNSAVLEDNSALRFESSSSSKSVARSSSSSVGSGAAAVIRDVPLSSNGTSHVGISRVAEALANDSSPLKLTEIPASFSGDQKESSESLSESSEAADPHQRVASVKSTADALAEIKANRETKRDYSPETLELMAILDSQGKANTKTVVQGVKADLLPSKVCLDAGATAEPVLVSFNEGSSMIRSNSLSDLHVLVEAFDLCGGDTVLLKQLQPADHASRSGMLTRMRMDEVKTQLILMGVRRSHIEMP